MRSSRTSAVEADAPRCVRVTQYPDHSTSSQAVQVYKYAVHFIHHARGFFDLAQRNPNVLRHTPPEMSRNESCALPGADEKACKGTDSKVARKSEARVVRSGATTLTRQDQNCIVQKYVIERQAWHGGCAGRATGREKLCRIQFNSKTWDSTFDCKLHQRYTAKRKSHC